MCFSKIKSQYYINLAEAVHRIRPDLASEIMIEDGWFEESRSLTEILEVVGALIDKIWYNRHQNSAYLITKGKIKLIEKEKFTIESSQRTMVKEI